MSLVTLDHSVKIRFIRSHRVTHPSINPAVYVQEMNLWPVYHKSDALTTKVKCHWLQSSEIETLTFSLRCCQSNIGAPSSRRHEVYPAPRSVDDPDRLCLWSHHSLLLLGLTTEVCTATQHAISKGMTVYCQQKQWHGPWATHYFFQQRFLGVKAKPGPSQNSTMKNSPSTLCNSAPRQPTNKQTEATMQPTKAFLITE